MVHPIAYCVERLFIVGVDVACIFQVRYFFECTFSTQIYLDFRHDSSGRGIRTKQHTFCVVDASPV